ncbi:MAG: ATP-dependent RNA helicase HrpA [Gammaproteobacteria bacterium]|nr:ATP-dependent RNA helicase HrpA [Gammaproteobacteria bacterium]
MSSSEPAPNTRSGETREPERHCMRRDRKRLERLRRAGRKREYEALYGKSHALRQARAGNLPALRCDEALPITARKGDIQQAIHDHQVVVVCGETGSGKSTQLPKFCLEMGRGIDGYIGHTQPRRVAARAIAARLADELDSEIGGHAGYKLRFEEQLGDETYVKVLTDGMLLAELETDRLLAQYDTLIIDEAHERSLNIDFLLGVLKRLLPRRPDLKVIITSATIDPQKFSRYFDDAPVLEVSGRTWPVEIRYRPFNRDGGDSVDRDLEVALLHAVDELFREGPGDILIFLPGEYHIHKTAGLLRKKHYRDTEILPLYARLPGGEQQRIFRPGGRRRIVLATNVAETSITVPGIRFVIDTGLARISRYRPARQVQALPVEPVSRASASQRAGRCGREADGICIRLYSEDDFNAREEFTPPEVQRTSLASVILTMHNLRLGDVEEFPFLEPPPPRMVKAGYRLLEELGAIDGERRLTATGRRLARIPADPRIGRMLLAADDHRCTNEVLTIAAALSVQDPREYPVDRLDQARQAHAEYRHGKSDFLGLLNLWERYRRDTRDLSRRQRTRYCRDRYLSTTRMREWRNVRDQLKSIARELGIRSNDAPAAESAVHKALLTGLLGNIARRHMQNEYLGTQGKKLYIHRSSALFKHRPDWLMCAELVQTGKLYARTNAAIDPAWAEAPAAHLVRRQYLEPYWDTGRGEVMAKEQVTLHGLTLVRGRRTRFSVVDPAESRRIFIRQALVAGDIDPAPDFLSHNMEMIRRATDLEQRERRRGIAIDEEQLFEFYDKHLPHEVCDSRSLSSWLDTAPAERVRALQLDADTARPGPVDDRYPERFPEYFEVNDNRLALRYRFEPGHPCDGVTLRVPAPLLGQLPEERLSWLVPGLLVDRMTALIRALPREQRRGLGPANDAALLCLRRMAPREGESLAQCMSRTFSEQRGVEIPVDDWDESSLPAHLRMNIEVVDADGEVLDQGRDPGALRDRVGQSVEASQPADEPLPDWIRDGLTTWSFGDLPETIEYRQSGIRLRSFLALRDDGDSVAVAMYDREHDARAAMDGGVERLVRLEVGAKLNYLRKNLPQADRMCLNFASVGSCDALRRDIIDAAMTRSRATDPWRVRSRGGFDREAATVGERLVPAAAEICAAVAPALERFRDCKGRLDALPPATRDDIAQQLDLLVFPGFVHYTPGNRLAALDRYLQAVQKRMARCARDPRRDLARMERIREYWIRLLMDYPLPPDPVPPELFAFRWMLEEFRVSVFAQELGTGQPVSEKRLDAQWDAWRRSRG